ncbi:MAG TPA: hypothetical protein VFJ58_13630 [Armatimonadota bacterium]|nr:hypothetical protein [Armatimonadota bacterium]
MGGDIYDPPLPDKPYPSAAGGGVPLDTGAGSVKEAAAPGPGASPAARATAIHAARLLWFLLEGEWDREAAVGLRPAYGLFCYRAAVADGGTIGLQANWRWQLDLWDAVDRQQFESAMLQGHQRLLANNPQMEGQQY